MADDVTYDEVGHGAPLQEPGRPPAPIEEDARADSHHDEEMPNVQVTRRGVAFAVLFIVSVLAFLYFVLPQITGFHDTWQRIERGDPLWLGAAAAFTVLSFLGYVVLFQAIFAPGAPRKLTVSESYQITMAGLAATRLFAAAGAGGVALQAWALRRAGMPRRMVADRTIAFLAMQYSIYMLALVVVGIGLRVGLFPGPAPFGMTIVPAVFGAVTLGIGLLISLTPTDLQRRMDDFACRNGRLAKLTRRLANAPAAVSAGFREAIQHLRRHDVALVGAIAYWAFNIAVLWSAFKAFGQAPPWAVIVMAYFVGMLGNLLPLPGGVGGVDGGMIGACIALGVDHGLAVVAVLTYRAFAFWLPTLPGVVAYFQLRRTVARWREQSLSPAG